MGKLRARQVSGRNLLVITGPEIRGLLRGREREVSDAVELAYRQHAAGDTSLPQSTFLLFPEQPQNRIIALPAYLGGGRPVAGIKWIASFPGNAETGLDRASAVLVLNSVDDGVPETILEGSIISAKRTAASALLAAKSLAQEPPPSIGVIGCGLINAEILRFLMTAFAPRMVVLFDKEPEKAARFAERVRGFLSGNQVVIAKEAEEVLGAAPLVSMATTASEPHIESLSRCPAGATILHISLRDLSVSSILSSDNVVDDVDHVCRARTSVHLAEKATGSRDFIRCNLGEILSGQKPSRRDLSSTVVFSPFGLGILDLAVGRLVRDLAAERGIGTRIGSFLPEPWLTSSAQPLANASATGRVGGPEGSGGP
jgi:2,3-diaminopropionate biosynthesis protein SbnB